MRNRSMYGAIPAQLYTWYEPLRPVAGSKRTGVVTESNLFCACKLVERSIMNCVQTGLVFSHDDEPSTKAKPSKSKSIPSKLLVTTRFVIVETTSFRVLDFARYPYRTNFLVPSVIAGSILKPCDLSTFTCSVMLSDGFAEVN